MEEIRIGDILMMPATIELDKKIKTMADNDIVVAVTSDSSLLAEIPYWCQLTGHNLVKARRRGGDYRFYVQRISEEDRRNRSQKNEARPITSVPEEEDESPRLT